MNTGSKTLINHTVYDAQGLSHIVTEENELDANGQVKPGSPVFKCATLNGPIVSNLPAGFTIDGVVYTSIDPSMSNQTAPDKAKAIANMQEMRDQASGQKTTAMPKKTD